MKIKKPVEDIGYRMREFLLGAAKPSFAEEDPFRQDLFSYEQMIAHAASLAKVHKTVTDKAQQKILPRLDDNESLITRVYELLTESVNEKHTISPASEWFLDNYYLIKEQIVLGRTHLPKKYSEELPMLTSGRSAGLPRVYDIALELIAHSDGYISIPTLTGFLTSYQTVTTLTLGELWAIPIMLRLALIENIRRIASSVALDRLDKNTAIEWSERLIETSRKSPKDIILVIAEMAKARLPLGASFVAEFIRQLQGKGSALSIALSWMEEQLSDDGTSSQELILTDNQRQAADQVSIRNSIESLRLIKSTNWQDFVEEVSVVEKILRQDPHNVYTQMDFATRDRYRHIVEWVSKHSRLEEYEVAQKVIELAQASAQNNEPRRRHHVGYYLVDEVGQQVLIRKTQMQITARHRIKRILKYNRLASYVGASVIITFFFSFWAGIFVYKHGYNYWWGIGTGLLCFIAFSQVFIVLINWVSSLLVSPKPLPKMDYSGGIPPEFSTLIAVPCMLTSHSSINELTEELEVRHLANLDENLYFSLLTDFTDADAATMPGDESLLDHAAQRIRELNQKYSKNGTDKFYLFHRPRKWNPSEKKWMGRERKRGKLEELNSLLRGAGHDDFSLIIGNVEQIRHVKYVITLDADTQLPLESAWKMIATMAHPLNSPVIDKKLNRVVEGYGIMQPRTATSIPGTNSTLYAKLHSMDSGLDPYTQLVSDVYQDLFSEGSYVGKGIYDIDVFERILGGAFPRNRILSHDLLEGSYVRSGLITDVTLFEEYPQTYWADANRKHRWIRGDWQIASWGTPFIPGENSKLKRNFISSLSRWKIWDNLRRSLVAPATMLLLLLSWTVLPNPAMWTLFFLLSWFLPVIVTGGWHLFHKPQRVDLKTHLTDVLNGFTTHLSHILLSIICLPFEAFMNADAIFRANWRMLISRRHLLEWTPSGIAQKSKKTWLNTYGYMWPCIFLSLILGGIIGYYKPDILYLVLPFITIWLLAPYISWYISTPHFVGQSELSFKEIATLRVYARKTWAYFEDFVTEEDNWLAPDNYQEHPVESLAHRTSPTNIAFALLGNLSAYDFGYLPVNDAVHRTVNTFETLKKMERYRGHLYNWYDTQTLEPLNPRYISTVDSGNFTASVITLREGLKNLPDDAILDEKCINGLKDILQVSQHLKEKKARESVFAALSPLLDALQQNNLSSLTGIRDQLQAIGSVTATIMEKLKAQNNQDEFIWLAKMEEQVNAFLRTLDLFTPWASLLPLPPHWEKLSFLHQIPSINDIVSYYPVAVSALKEYRQEANDNHIQLLDMLAAALDKSFEQCMQIKQTIQQLSDDCTIFSTVEYDFLYDKKQRLFHIGFNVTEYTRDSSYYDMLASEARLGIFTAIAQGKISQASWFALGRLVTNVNRTPVLLSWSGSMFEYLMPQLIMPSYENSLLDRTAKGVVKNQIDYARKNNIPWGISESGYNLVDTGLHYQYQAFGVPGLGLKRGLSGDLVIAPYATMLALMVDQRAAYDNLQILSKRGYEGHYGFYEAIDFTASRMPRGQSEVIIKSFMVHHMGMSFLALAHTLLDQKMQQRFEQDPQFRAALLLLQERAPQSVSFYSSEENVIERHTATHESHVRMLNTAQTPVPEIQLLSNGRYMLMLSNSGGGFSRWKDIAINRWREDTTLDNWGIFVYIKDVESKEFWSNTFQPTLKQPEAYETIFSQGHIEFRRMDQKIETKTDVVVSPEDDVEIRRIKISNRSSSARVLEITSYCEIVLTDQPTDEAHPAFSNLFVQTKIDEEKKALIFSRRPRRKDSQLPWMFTSLQLNQQMNATVSYETDRMRFIGRGLPISNPAALQEDGPLSNTQGSVLDPVAAVRYRIALKPRQTVTFDLVTGIAEDRDSCYALLEKYHDQYIKKRAFELAWTHSQVILRQINATEIEAQLFNSIAGSILYSNNRYRANSDTLIANAKGQSGLWSYAISGDLPIILLRVKNGENMDLVKQLVKAHAYWSLKGLKVDLVIWNDDVGSYRQELQNQITGFITASGNTMDQPGGIFVRSGDQIPYEDRILFQTVARLIFDEELGSLTEQVNRKLPIKALPAPFKKSEQQPVFDNTEELSLPDYLVFNNGIGGFTEDGKEYILLTSPHQKTPAPWCNVIANPVFGSVLSESGPTYSWKENAQAFRLTPWHNDPVSDKSGEAFYLRDEELGHFWSPTPLPAPSGKKYITRHGFGYSVYEHLAYGIYSEMWIYIDPELPVKYFVIKIRNNTPVTRSLTATGYMEWILGDTASKSRMYIYTEKDLPTGVLFTHNRYNTAFTDKVVFFDTDSPEKTFTCDRSEFIGRNGTMKEPAALQRKNLSGRTGAGIDPCTAIQVKISLAANEEKEIIFRLGVGDNEQDARTLAQKTKGASFAHNAQSALHDKWNSILGAIQIKTPDKAMDIMTNGWWAYQALSSRIWGRSGFYQSGGAFGFRDQLQDVLALMHTSPQITKQQILLAASRQFKEGDVQHWWHPPTGRGVRTTCSDDYLWLPYVTARYLETTHDWAILDEYVSYIDGRPLRPDEESYYDLPVVLNHWESLYNHCKNAIHYGLKFGIHGLPLIGSGDWNDGMDKIGEHGQGESVWLAFFLYDVLKKFEKIALNYGDMDFNNLCRAEAEKLKENIRANAWDGQWYRRAYFDDGTPLGSKQNDECKIDSISQSWSVISKAGDEERSRVAMESLNKYLIDRENGIIKLLDPPFDKSDLYPGYIKGYLPGVRENGGQYTHAAIWTIMAYAHMKDRDRVWELFSLVNPVNHGKDMQAVAKYKVEPYIMAADVYGAAPHQGRGGWTWYTGSAGWTYQLAIEHILGLTRRGEALYLNPCIPEKWDGFEITYRYGNTFYSIHVKNSNKKGNVVLYEDQSEITEGYINLKDDGQPHIIIAEI